MNRPALERVMPAFCHFWNLTPDAFRDLDYADFIDMAEYQERWLNAQKASR